MTRSPMNRPPVLKSSRIDLSRVPSSMEQMAAGWAIKAAIREMVRDGELVTQETEVPRLRELLARDLAQMAAHQAELERDFDVPRPGAKPHSTFADGANP